MDFKHILPIQLRFNDVDPFGHVNNSVYFTFYDLGKTTYLKDLIEQHHLRRDGMAIVLVNANANFLSPVVANEHVSVQTAVVEVGHKSFKLLQQLIDVDTQEVKCICSSVMVAFDSKTQTSMPLPEEWKKYFCEYEGRDLRKK